MGTCCRDNSGGPAGPPDTRTPIREGEGRQAATGCAVARTNHHTLVISCSGGKGNLVHTQPVVIDHTKSPTARVSSVASLVPCVGITARLLEPWLLIITRENGKTKYKD